MLEATPIGTPMVPCQHLDVAPSPMSDEDAEYMQDKPYLHAVGKLNYLAFGTRPDIAFTVSNLACLGSNPAPSIEKWSSTSLDTIKGTMNYKITHGSSPHPTAYLIYSDADYAKDTVKPNLHLVGSY